MLQTRAALIREHKAAAPLQKVEIRGNISSTKDETGDPFVFFCEWALTIRAIHPAWYCAGDANRAVEGVTVLTCAILQLRPNVECTGGKLQALATAAV